RNTSHSKAYALTLQPLQALGLSTHIVRSKPLHATSLLISLTLRGPINNNIPLALDEFNMRILVIEDEPKTAEYLHQGLTESGYIVDKASTGLDGLHLVRQHTYDLVILDVNLPEIDGWGVLENLRRDN